MRPYLEHSKMENNETELAVVSRALLSERLRAERGGANVVFAAKVEGDGLQLAERNSSGEWERRYL